MRFIEDYCIALGKNWMRINDLNRKQGVIGYDKIGVLGFRFCIYCKALRAKATFISANTFATRS